MSQYKEELWSNNYTVIPGFLDSCSAKELSDEFREFADRENLQGDSQSESSQSVYNYLPFLEILCQKCPEVSIAIGETVLPTYTYARVYKNGAVLEGHTDRNACEISLTVNLDGDQEWPIWIETPDGKEVRVSLNPGDAMIYLGCTARHWREEYKGDWYTQCFLHYVRSRGDKVHAVFDSETKNKPNVGVKNYLTHKKVKEEERVIEETPKVSDNMEIVISEDGLEMLQEKKVVEVFKEAGTNTLEQYVKVFYDVVPEDLCDAIIEEYSNSNEWKLAETGGGLQTDIRNVDEIGISDDLTIGDSALRRELDNRLFKSVESVSIKYQEEFKHYSINVDTGYNLLRYKEGQFYTQHTDSFVTQQRSLSCSLILNDDYEGGEFCFWDGTMMHRPPKGAALVFPSNFMYPHEIRKVTKGERYSIITWLV